MPDPIKCFMVDDDMSPSTYPVGAMWNCPWYNGENCADGTPYNRYSDGLILCVMTPGGEWLIDGPSFVGGKESGHWTRTGTAPNITVSPSILQPGYHGWLRDGMLVSA